MKNTRHLNTIAYFIIFILLFIAYFPSFWADPLGDDLFYIFNNQNFLSVTNLFDFWSSKDNTRSWPISFALLRWFHSLWDEQYHFYRYFNLFIHTVNILLVYRILAMKLDRRVIFFMLLPFAFHPSHFETIFWIFQLKTLASTAFFLCAYLAHSKALKNKEAGVMRVFSYFFFYCSLYSKSIAIIFPCFLVIELLSVYKPKKMLLLVAPYFLLSLFSGYQTVKGVWYHEGERAQIAAHTQTEIIETNQLVKDETHKKGISIEVESTKQPLNSLETFTIKDTLLGDPLFKGILFLSNLSFYVHHYFYLYPASLYYNFNPLSIYFFLTGFIFSMFFLIVLIRKIKEKKIDELTLGISFFIISFIPISGLIYVPYMKYSYVANHWNYLGTIGLSLMCYSFLKTMKLRKKYIESLIVVFSLLGLIQTRLVSQRLSNLEEYLTGELIKNPNSLFLKEQLIANFKDNGKDVAASLLIRKTLIGQTSAENSLRYIVASKDPLLHAEYHYSLDNYPRALGFIERALKGNVKVERKALVLKKLCELKIRGD